MKNNSLSVDQLNTVKGLKFVIPANLFIFLSFIVLLAVFNMELFDLGLAWICFFSLGTIFFLIGYWWMYRGREEFSGDHERYYRFMPHCISAPFTVANFYIWLFLCLFLTPFRYSVDYLEFIFFMILFGSLIAWEVGRFLSIYMLLERKYQYTLMASLSLVSICYLIIMIPFLGAIYYDISLLNFVISAITISFGITMVANIRVMKDIHSGKLKPRDMPPRVASADIILPDNKEQAYEMMREAEGIVLPQEPEEDEEEEVDFYRTAEELEKASKKTGMKTEAVTGREEDG
jgi:hypothetical protein